MQSVLDVFNRLLSDSRTEDVKLSITADKKMIMIEVDECTSISADDDMIVIRETKKIFGVPYDTDKHMHPLSFDDLYEQIVRYLICKGKS